MSTFEVYSTDQNKEEEGVPVNMIDGSTVYIARTTSKRVRQANEKARKPYRATIQRAERMGEDLDEEITNEIAMKTTINGVIVDWEGVTDENGKELPFNETNARYILENLPEFHSHVLEEAGKASNFQDDEVEEGKNA